VLEIYLNKMRGEKNLLAKEMGETSAIYIYILMDIRVGVLKRERFVVKLSSIYIYFFKFLFLFACLII
jgi:hypothetical protein